jgi:hypothetical protein
LAYNFLLAAILSNYLKQKGIIWSNNKKLDTDFLLTIMIRAYNNDPIFFPAYMINTEKILEEVILGRRAVAHGFLPLILQRG